MDVAPHRIKRPPWVDYDRNSKPIWALAGPEGVPRGFGPGFGPRNRKRLATIFKTATALATAVRPRGSATPRRLSNGAYCIRTKNSLYAADFKLRDFSARAVTGKYKKACGTNYETNSAQIDRNARIAKRDCVVSVSDLDSNDLLRALVGAANFRHSSLTTFHFYGAAGSGSAVAIPLSPV